MGFRQAYPDRKVNNVYFDTPGWRTFNDNLAGISERTKYRLRWYGCRSGPIRESAFELKRKENLLGTKIIFSIDKKIDWEMVPGLPRSLPQVQVNGLFPSLVNEYWRSYYHSADGRFRLTIDREMQCAPYRSRPERLRSFEDNLLVVELKYGRDQDHLLDEFTQYWPLRMDRFSKYVNGMQLVYS